MAVAEAAHVHDSLLADLGSEEVEQVLAVHLDPLQRLARDLRGAWTVWMKRRRRIRTEAFCSQQCMYLCGQQDDRPSRALSSGREEQ